MKKNLRAELIRAIHNGSTHQARVAFARYADACAAANSRSYHRNRTADFANIDRLITEAAKQAARSLRIPAKLKLPGHGSTAPSAASIQALLAMADLISINCSLERKEAFLDLMAKVFAQDGE